jgi:tetratricopeptide (TPR) repeat protein
MHKTLSIVVLLVALLCVILAVPAGAEDAAALIAQGDAAWEARGPYGDLDNQEAVDSYRAGVLAAPFSYEAHWKAARSLWWLADGELRSSGNKGRQADWGREGMELAGRAVLISPDGVEGHVYWALSALHYAYGVGMVDALREGIEDEIEKHLRAAYERDKAYERGLVPRTLSTFLRTTPWPKRDNKRALALAREAVDLDPSGVRTAVFTAACLEAAGERDEAMELLKKASEMEGDKALEPDWKWWRRFAKKCVDDGKVIDPDLLF